jgi:hypothetical protein
VWIVAHGLGNAGVTAISGLLEWGPMNTSGFFLKKKPPSRIFATLR